MNFQQLQYIVEISRCGSMNKAAQNLYVSHSTISSAIRSLEFELGIKLFERTSGGISFTGAGRAFVAHASSMLDQKEQLEAFCSSQSAQSGSKVQLSIASQRYVFIEEAVFRLCNRLDQASYDIRYFEKNMNQVIDMVADADANIGVISLTAATEKVIRHALEGRRLEYTELISLMPRVLCSAHHPLTKKSQVTESDLASYPYVRFRRDLGTPIDFDEEYPLAAAHSSDRIFTTNTRVAVFDLLRTSDAYTIGCGLLTPEFSRDLTSLPLAGISDPISVGYITPKDLLSPNPLLPVFLETSRETIELAISHTLDRG